MLFIPSLLEYSASDLEKKLQLIKSNFSRFVTIQNPALIKNKKATANLDRTIAFHLDFVLPEFAKDRNVMTGLSVKETILILKKEMLDYNLELSWHFMGLDLDYQTLIYEIPNLKLPTNWKNKYYIGDKYALSVKSVWPENMQNETGFWLDLDEWSTKDEKLKIDGAKTFLLMTVKAGKSGQILTPEIMEKVFKLAKNNPAKSFILDGGWPVTLKQKIPKNVRIVSYTSFWKAFLT